MTNSTHASNVVAAFLIVFRSWTVYYKIPTFPVYLLFVFIVFFYNSPFNKRQLVFYCLFVLVAFRFFLNEAITTESVLIAFVRASVTGSVFLIRPLNQRRIIDLMILILSYIVLIGLVQHLFKLFGILKVPILNHLIFEDGRAYNIYIFNVYEISRYTGVELNFRFNSIFDEPGFLGTISALILIYEKFNFFRIRNILIGLGGLFSLSLAFFIIVTIYYFLQLIKFKKVHSVSIVKFVLIFLLFSLFFPYLSNLIFDRFSYESGYGLTGDSRGGLVAFQESIMILSNENLLSFLFGSGYDSFLKYQGYYIANSNVYRLLLQIGILGFLYLVFIIFIFRKNKYENIIFIFAFILSIYQRPQIFEFIFLILLSVNLEFHVTEKVDRVL